MSQSKVSQGNVNTVTYKQRAMLDLRQREARAQEEFLRGCCEDAIAKLFEAEDDFAKLHAKIEELRELLSEWLETEFFSDKSDKAEWDEWCAEFGDKWRAEFATRVAKAVNDD